MRLSVQRLVLVGALAALLAGPAIAEGDKDAAAAAVGGNGWNAEVAPAGDGVVLAPEQTALVKKVDDYFNSLTTLQGKFIQIGADKKRMRGKFFVKRPGKFRFEYNRPSRQLIVSDGEYLAVQDLDIETEDRVALDQTPFRLLLRKEVNLLKDAKILRVEEIVDTVTVALQDKSPDSPGRITLIMSKEPFELQQWTTLDAQNLETTVKVGNLEKGGELDVSMFKIKPVGLTRAHP